MFKLYDIANINHYYLNIKNEIKNKLNYIKTFSFTKNKLL